jgi:hypothetical protein
VPSQLPLLTAFAAASGRMLSGCCWLRCVAAATSVPSFAVALVLAAAELWFTAAASRQPAGDCVVSCLPSACISSVLSLHPFHHLLAEALSKAATALKPCEQQKDPHELCLHYLPCSYSHCKFHALAQVQDYNLTWLPRWQP